MESVGSAVTGTISCAGAWSVVASSSSETFSGSLPGGGAVSGTWSVPGVNDTGPWSGSVKPVVTSISPTSGLAAGGTKVKITGSGFGGLTAVDFGGTPAAILKINKK